MAYAIGVDVGGTKVAAGVVDDAGGLVAEVREPTPGSSPDDTLDVIVGLVEQLRRDHDVVAVGVGAAGWVDAEGARVLFAPNLAWRDEPLRDRLAEQLDVPVAVENDANAAAWAEHRFGAGRGESHLVVLTVGTGIGGGIIIDGRLMRGRWGLAGEPGHVCVVPSGEECGCGNRGCLEQYVSGTALRRLARARAMTDPAAASAVLALGSGDVDGLEGGHVTEAAVAGDDWAARLLADLGRNLGQALADIAALLDPGTFVIGGGVADAGELLLGPARDRFAEVLTGDGHRPVAEIRRAELGNTAGLIGAADLARSLA